MLDLVLPSYDHREGRPRSTGLKLQRRTGGGVLRTVGREVARCGGPHPRGEQVVGVGATGRYEAATPADAPSVLTEGACGDERVLVGVHRPGRCRTAQRGDVERVGRAVRLAHEAGLAVALAGDDRNPVRPAVEDSRGRP